MSAADAAMPDLQARVDRADRGDRVAVVAAMRAEMSPLLASTHVERRLRVDGCRMVAGRLKGRAVVLGWTGEGAERARCGVRAMLDRFPASALIVLGVSGGLSSGLPSGTLLAAHRLRTADGSNNEPAPDAAWLERALALGSVQAATVLSSDRILSTKTSKVQAAESLPRDLPAAVDLESVHYARVAAESGLAFLVLRAVCDAVDEELPLDLDRCRDGEGGISRLRVVREALLHPAAVGGLWNLHRRVARSAVDLAALATELIGEERP